MKRTVDSSGETLVCDSSFVGHLARRDLRPGRYEHWDDSLLNRIEGASLAISIVTIAEIRAGYVSAGLGGQRVPKEELALARFMPLLIDNPHLDEWARLWSAARAGGVALSHNDLWIAATASVRENVLVTCDRDHVRIAKELPVEVVYLAPPV